jgi:CDP-diacylglycerol--glycerol-3-phosphate 3-phosphatidyltransferase
MSDQLPRERLLTIPNLLTLARLPLSAVLFACIAYECWLAALIVFAIASITDWLDGWLARKLNQQSALGRNLDPLIDKVLTGGAFIYLMPVDGSELMPWMVTVVIGRELLITGIRGIMETQGLKFGADWFGKLKTVLQMITLVAILAILWLRTTGIAGRLQNSLHVVQLILIYAMLIATVGSGLQYLVRATRNWMR